ncbi:MAG TPA: F0F1 ATP synthase subunit B [Thermomicrobiaceae bacterium]|nr:F0F1 ATP synthase subunit B [Thermomicrobiaceae bacterium]
MSALGVNGWILAVQLFAFIVFILLFWKFALGPIVSMVDTRRERIEESMAAAERMQRELAATQARNEEILLEARREAQGILATARQNAEELRSQFHAQTEVEAQQILTRARQEIQAETQQAWQSLRRDVADLAIAAATKIVRHELNPQEQRRLIEETLAEAGTSSNGLGPA